MENKVPIYPNRLRVEAPNIHTHTYDLRASKHATTSCPIDRFGIFICKVKALPVLVGRTSLDSGDIMVV